MKVVALFILMLISTGCSVKTIKWTVKDYPEPVVDVEIKSLGNYVEGEPIELECIIKNNTKTRQSVWFVEKRDLYDRVYDDIKWREHAVCFSALIKDEAGNKLCKYTTKYHAGSSEYWIIGEYDYIHLNPGDSIVRIIDVTKIPIVCNCSCGRGFVKGKYSVQVTVNNTKSNVLCIEVKD